MKIKEDAFNRELSKMIRSGELNKFYSKNSPVYEIPVVVHVVSDGSPLGSSCNRTDAEVINWINHTNDIYSGNSAPGISTPIPVKLVLAKIDPNCNPTNGINRINASHLTNYVTYGVDSQANQSGLYQLDMTALGKWDPTKYYNIYVVKDTAGGGVPNGGWATFASNHGNNTDHAIIHYTAITSPSRHHVLSHEFGHAMSLYHTQQGSSGSTCPANNDCTLDGDLVCDTEPNILSSPGTTPCQAGQINPCTGIAYAGAESNIMTYTACYRDRFTAGQRDRAIAQLLYYRQSLLNSPVLNTTPINNTVSLTPACTPATITGPSNYNYGITYVKFGEINNYSRAYQQSANNFYENFTGSYCLGKATTTIPLTNATTITIAPGPASSSNPAHLIRAYIDYNNDGQFNETTERILSQTVSAGSVATSSITPPPTAVLNTPLRLRVIGDSNNFASSVNACYNPARGQVEDYSITIQSQTLSTNKEITNTSPIITKVNSSVYVRSDRKILSVTLYDASGRIVLNREGINSTEFKSSSLDIQNAIIFVNVILEKGETIVRKIKF
ncbi:hypothetical protein HNP38_002186 [Chryseobacterium defluvii]|uniref:Pregnancy-associated plasma protein-A n=1 Tax=Chryseobacterium defluvii TaxID=160396 RepID=A0A840KHB2_9FLAO|nr:GEVED domain-containing protein [Chryseobacterium defluvii]MBB4806890.1 hypothetical protein [Chryseobacterium defluvii]